MKSGQLTEITEITQIGIFPISALWLFSAQCPDAVENASQSSVLQQLLQRLAQNNAQLSAAAAGLADPQALADTSVLRLLVRRGSRAAVGNPAAPPL